MFEPEQLSAYLSPGPERVGFVLRDGAVVEVPNRCHDPENGFDVSPTDLLKYEDDVTASWHTHPGCSSNLSEADRQSFLNYPDWDHYIIGDDGVARYAVHSGIVVLAQAHLLPRNA